MPFFTGERSIMIFSSLPFLFFYLVAVLAVYKLSPLKLRNLILLVVSLFFYGWGEPVYILIMLLSIVVDYVHGMLVERWREDDRKARRAVASSVFFNLAILVFFKYWDFLAGNLNALTGLQLPVLGLPLPIGISFYTFQTMSYTIDVYRGDARAQRSILNFGTFVTLFPQLIAGPIIKYKDLGDQINERTCSTERFASGVQILMVGLAKKLLIANNVGMLWDSYKAMAPAELTVAGAWLGVLAFTFQIYFDFSGYSDMAIGLGRCLGFHFRENFNHPYCCTSITDFWRRWHISLGSFFRDYVYIPLGGNRSRWFLNILIVWFLTGMWHGASWNFIIWGLYFGLIVMVEKFTLLPVHHRIPRPLLHVYSLLLIVIGWGIFYFDDMGDMGKFFHAFAGGAYDGFDITVEGAVFDRFWLWIAGIIFCMPTAFLRGYQSVKMLEPDHAGKFVGSDVAFARYPRGPVGGHTAYKCGYACGSH